MFVQVSQEIAGELRVSFEQQDFLIFVGKLLSDVIGEGARLPDNHLFRVWTEKHLGCFFSKRNTLLEGTEADPGGAAEGKIKQAFRSVRVSLNLFFQFPVFAVALVKSLEW